MRLDDRPAYRQSHAHSVRLGCKKRVKQVLAIRSIESFAGITHRNDNFTVVIDNLEKAGYVRRERGYEDRRVVMVHLTDTGRDRIKAVLPDFVKAVVRDMQVLSPAQQEQLAVLLRCLGRQQSCKDLPEEGT